MLYGKTESKNLTANEKNYQQCRRHRLLLSGSEINQLEKKTKNKNSLAKQKADKTDRFKERRSRVWALEHSSI